MSYAVQPGATIDYKNDFAHVLATRLSYDIYVGGCRSHITRSHTYNTKRTFAGKEDCVIRTVVIPPVGSLLVMRARDTREFYVARVIGAPKERIEPCSPDSLPWNWAYRIQRHKDESLASWTATLATGLPAEDYIISIPVDEWRRISEPTEEQKKSFGVRRRTIQKMSVMFPLATPTDASAAALTV